MVTLVHAFLHYAMRGNDAFGLKAKNFSLKSYAIAQPKLGNYSFGADFARITQSKDSAIVINNHIDPVPKVPLTFQETGDLENDFRGGSFLAKALRMVSGFGVAFHRAISRLFELFVTDSAAGYGYFYKYENIKPIGHDTAASS